MSGPFKMKGSPMKRNFGIGSPVKLTDEEKQANLLKAVPNKEAYDKLSAEDKKGFDATGAKVGLPTKKSPAKQNMHFDIGPSDGVTSSDIETGKESAYRGHSPRGNVVDVLRRRKGETKPPTDKEQKRMTEYSIKHGHRKPTEWEKIKSDFTGKSEKSIITTADKKTKKKKT